VLNRKWVLIGFGVVLVTVAAGALAWRRQTHAGPPKAPQVQATTFSEISLPARLEAIHITSVPAPIEGRIEAFHADIGADVYEGQLLVQIKNGALEGAQEAALLDFERVQQRVHELDSALTSARLEASRAAADASRARSEYDRASKVLQREKMLIEQGATPRLVFEKAERDFNTIEAESKNADEVAKQSEERVSGLQAELDNARKILDGETEELERAKTRVTAGDIYSPATGTVVGRRGEAGGDVNPTMTDLFQIATDLSVLRAVADVTPEQASQLKPGLGAMVVLAEMPNDPLPGTITSVEGGRVTVEFANPNPAVKPGLTAQVRIRLT
jgi:multidrug resistance efflux pump